MTKILSRPMFRKGGSANNGIMDGLVDRKGYATAGLIDKEVVSSNVSDIRDLLTEFSPQPKDTSFYEMLIGGGLKTVSGEHAGQGLMANLAGSYKGPSEKFFEKQQAMKDYDRKMGSAAAQMGIEHELKMKELERKDDPNKALRNIYLTQAIENGYDAPEAQRIADYQITTKTQLQNKVGRERIGGLIEFDLNDAKQMKKQLPKMKKDIGKYFYDPYDGKIKQLVEKNGVLGFNEFNSVADITFGLDEGTSTVSSTPYADELEAIEQEKGRGYVPDEDIVAQRFP